MTPKIPIAAFARNKVLTSTKTKSKYTIEFLDTTYYDIIEEQYFIIKHTFKKENFSPDIGHCIKSSFTAILVARVGSGIKNARKLH